MLNGAINPRARRADDHRRGWIVFSGMVAQIQNTFHTDIHQYQVGARAHSGAAPPSVPAKFGKLIGGIRGRDNATHGLAVSFPASLPEVTAVAGTKFYRDDSGWNSRNSLDLSSVFGYLPETGTTLPRIPVYVRQAAARVCSILSRHGRPGRECLTMEPATCRTWHSPFART
jgi:subtilase family serine protease